MYAGQKNIENCFQMFEICAIFRSRMFVIYDKPKYSSDMFYDLKLSEMVHPGSVFMTGMISRILCMFFLPKEHPHMFFPCQNPFEKAALHQNIPIVIFFTFLPHILCYSYSELPNDVEIYFRFFSKNFRLNQRCRDDGCTGHVLDDLLFFRPS